jgi:hypothetical protein
MFRYLFYLSLFLLCFSLLPACPSFPSIVRLGWQVAVRTLCVPPLDAESDVATLTAAVNIDDVVGDLTSKWPPRSQEYAMLQLQGPDPVYGTRASIQGALRIWSQNLTDSEMVVLRRLLLGLDGSDGKAVQHFLPDEWFTCL